jgi:twitching motility protein PilT
MAGKKDNIYDDIEDLLDDVDLLEDKDEKPEGARNLAAILGMKEPKAKLDELLKEAKLRNATDLHINAGNPPYLKIHGEMVPIPGCPPLDEGTVRSMIFSCMTGEQNARFIEELDIDFSYSLPGFARFRVNALFEKNFLGAVFRVIPENPFTLEQLGVPEVIKKVCWRKQGLCLVTGRTGNGKTSTLAGCMQYVNDNRKIHLITIEDPIEFSFDNKISYIRQREVGIHTKSFVTGLKYALRQNPDIIMVGEMRDLETISIALTAAETGHLVFSTLHTFGAVETINRIIDPFPPEQQQQIRLQLSTALEAVFAQCLIPKANEPGVILACEIMMANPAVRNIIRDGRIHQLKQVIETHQEDGMISMEKYLLSLYERGLITFENAIAHAVDMESLRDMFRMRGISA